MFFIILLCLGINTKPLIDISDTSYFTGSALTLSLPAHPYLKLELDSTLVPKWVKQPGYDQESRNIIMKMTAEQDAFARIINFFIMVNTADHYLADSLLREIKATLYDTTDTPIAGYKYIKKDTTKILQELQELSDTLSKILDEWE